MDTTPITTGTPQRTTTTGSAGDPSVASANINQSVLTSDFEVFLQMLTAQAKYQDPLDPIDSSEYAAQLAQFSMVEQQVMTNELMENLISSMTMTDSGNIADWIGMEALTKGQTRYDGTPVTVVPADAPADAEGMAMVVQDSGGNEVYRRSYNLNEEQVQWNGEWNGQGTAPVGNYSIGFAYTIAGEAEPPIPAYTYNRVIEGRLSDGQTLLGLDSGDFVSIEAVNGIRAPQS